MPVRSLLQSRMPVARAAARAAAALPADAPSGLRRRAVPGRVRLRNLLWHSRVGSPCRKLFRVDDAGLLQQPDAGAVWCAGRALRGVERARPVPLRTVRGRGKRDGQASGRFQLHTRCYGGVLWRAARPAAAAAAAAAVPGQQARQARTRRAESYLKTEK